MRYKRGLLRGTWIEDKLARGRRHRKVEERWKRGWNGEFNKYWSLGDVSSPAGSLRRGPRKVPSLNLSKCLYFSLASIFPRDSRPISPLCAPNAAIFLTCPQNDILAHSPFNIFPTLPFALLSPATASYISYMSVARTLTLLSSAFLPFPATRAHLWCTRTGTRLLELRVTKTPRLLCMYAGIRCRGGWGILFFTRIPRGVAPAPLNASGAFRIPV